MKLKEAYKIIENYYNELYNYSQDSNWSNYDLDIAYTKDSLERIIMNKFILTKQDERFLESLLEDINDLIISSAIKLILNKSINEKTYKFVVIRNKDFQTLTFRSSEPEKLLLELISEEGFDSFKDFHFVFDTSKLTYSNYIDSKKSISQEDAYELYFDLIDEKFLKNIKEENVDEYYLLYYDMSFDDDCNFYYFVVLKANKNEYGQYNFFRISQKEILYDWDDEAKHIKLDIFSESKNIMFQEEIDNVLGNFGNFSMYFDILKNAESIKNIQDLKLFIKRYK